MTFLVLDRPLKGSSWSTVKVTACQGLAVLDAGTVKREHSIPRVTKATEHLSPSQAQIKIGKGNVSMGIHLLERKWGQVLFNIEMLREHVKLL